LPRANHLCALAWDPHPVCSGRGRSLLLSLQAGIAALVIDYRGFGGSDGTPRHHVSWSKHLQVG